MLQLTSFSMNLNYMLNKYVNINLIYIIFNTYKDMKIEFEREGGFSGIHISTTIDTSTLPDEERKKINSIIDASNFFTLKSEVDSSNLRSTADQFRYKITINKDDKIHTLEATDGTMDARLRPLLSYLGKKAIENKNKR
jgi:hypothetical protein